MTNGREGIDAKFTRAKELSTDLRRAAIDEFIVSDYIALDRTLNTAEKMWDTRARILKPLPSSFALLAGDAIHNARSALDHLAYRLVEVSGGQPDFNTFFPIVSSSGSFSDTARKRLRNVPAATRDLIRKMQPWNGGDDYLYRLHQADIDDKHHLLLPVFALASGIQINTAFDFGQGRPFGASFGIRSGEPDIVEDGTMVLRVTSEELPAGPVTQTYAPRFDLVFGLSSHLAGEPVVETIELMIQHVQTLVEPLVEMVR